MGEWFWDIAAVLVVLLAGVLGVWFSSIGCDPKQIGVESPESIVAGVEEAVATVVEKSLRENGAEWLPILETHSGKPMGIFNPGLDIAISTWAGPTGCALDMWEEVGPTAIKRTIELQPVQRARIWGAAKLVLDNHAAAERIEALTDVVERIGGVKK